MKKGTKKRQSSNSEDAAIARFYDSQSDEEQLVELEAALNAPDSVLVPIPRALLSDVLKLIEKKKKSA